MPRMPRMRESLSSTNSNLDVRDQVAHLWFRQLQLKNRKEEQVTLMPLTQNTLLIRLETCIDQIPVEDPYSVQLAQN